MRRGWLAAAIGVALGATLAAPRLASAYEFEVRARTMAQLWQLQSFRLVGADIWLERRRYTETLELDLYDLGGLRAARARAHRHDPGPVIYATGYLRLDHDFGAWTSGELALADASGGLRSGDAIDAIPELAASALAVDLLYGYVAVDGLLDGRVDLRLGRQVSVDTLDWFSMDGVTARVTTPWHVAVEAFAGLRVRDASPLGPASYELDGTTGADCTEYVEGPVGDDGRPVQQGSWQLIDRGRTVGDDPYASDRSYCPQREQAMPTFGAAIETANLHVVHARLTYRRSESRSVGIIEPGRPTVVPDLGYYPNELDQAPTWGVNEERIAGTVRGELELAHGRIQIEPYAAARWSLLHGLLDEAELGVRGRWGAHAVEPTVSRSVPTFDGDSIFNVFAVEPSTDARLTYDWSPRRHWIAATATAWMRWYSSGDAFDFDRDRDLDGPTTSGTAGGGSAAVEVRPRPSLRLRLDGLYDDGYGGRRRGGSASARWRRNAAWLITGRAAVLDIAPDLRDGGGSFEPGDDRDSQGAVTSWAQLGATWALADGVALHGVAEASYNRFDPGEVRTLGVLDLAFVPEL